MKATGIVRRIDDLGRVVIPKEIRRTLRIKEGAPLEIYTDVNGEVIFKKYSPMGELTSFAALYAEVLAKVSNMPVIISDCENIIAASGVSKREYMERRISPVVEELMETRRSYLSKPGESGEVHPVEQLGHCASVIYPIISSGDVIGSVIMLYNEEKTPPTDTELKLVQSAAVFLGKQMEE